MPGERLLGVLAVEAASKLRYDGVKAYARYGRKDSRVGGDMVGIDGCRSS